MLHPSGTRSVSMVTALYGAVESGGRRLGLLPSSWHISLMSCWGRRMPLPLLLPLLLVRSSANAAVPLPADWAPGVNAADLLFASSEPPAHLLPSIENGFLGGDVGCSGGAGDSAGVLHVAGALPGCFDVMFLQFHSE
eukprot:SAG31_NODE_12582_length_931_cov_1.080529_3_plen_138_part_00